MPAFNAMAYFSKVKVALGGHIRVHFLRAGVPMSGRRTWSLEKLNEDLRGRRRGSIEERERKSSVKWYG